METVNDRLRRLKKRHRTTIRAIAAFCEVSETTVYGWLKSTRPRTIHMAKLAEFFDVTIDYMVHGEQSEKRDQIVLELRTLVPNLSTDQLYIMLLTARQFAKNGT
ncbi:helix-turn-helix domain-containing protein [Chromobacterium vaccinii]|uniref:helix-turn-helix domain-containing protein n=1 Tax=Chromobacterium vaccinii TaxID=1108595 RepID=UPI003C74CF72